MPTRAAIRRRCLWATWGAISIGGCVDDFPVDRSAGSDTTAHGSSATTGSSGDAHTSSGTRGPDRSSSSGGATTAESGEPPVFDTPAFDVDTPAIDPVCSGDLKRVLDARSGTVLEHCPPAQGCLGGRCIPACDAAAGAVGSLGCEFIVPTSPFFANADPGAAQSGPCHALLVANPWDRDAQLDLSRMGMPFDVALIGRLPDGIADATTYQPLPATGIPSGHVAVLFASHRPGVHNGNSLECPVSPAVLADTAAHGTDRGAAFVLHSDTPIQVYDIIPYGGARTYLPSASLLYPTTAWSDAYVAVSPHEKDGDSWLLVAAVDDDTTVTVWPSATISEGAITTPPPNVGTDYVLHAGETLQWSAQADLAGSRVVADHPIGVWSGNTYLRVTTEDSPLSGRDSAHQMIPDVQALGALYAAAGATTRRADGLPESVRYRVVAVVDDTTLTVDPPTAVTLAPVLHAGQVIEFETREPFVVAAQDGDHPFSVSQYMGGAIEGRPGCTGAADPCRLGDDEWVVLPPPAQFTRDYTFFVDPTYGTTSLTLVRERVGEAPGEVTLDCIGPVGGWQTIDARGRFEWTHVDLFRAGLGATPACETSQHHAAGDGDFGIVVWGTDDAASYGYPAGGNLHTINEVDIAPAD